MLQPTNSAADPYYVCRDAVLSALDQLKTSFEDLKRVSPGQQFNKAYEEIVTELKNLEGELEEIEVACIQKVEQNRHAYGFDDQEMGSRKAFVKSSRETLKTIKSSLGNVHQSKMEDDRRAQLLKDAQAKKSRGEKQKSRQQMEDERALEANRQEQMQISAGIDDTMSLLANSTDQLKKISAEMNKEIRIQKDILEDLDKDIDEQTARMNAVMKRMGTLLKTNDNKHICIVISLGVMILILLFLVFNT